MNGFKMKTINLAPGCLQKYIVTHECIHALGFYHEQSRADRDNHIDIFWENIQPSTLSDNLLLNTYVYLKYYLQVRRFEFLCCFFQVWNIISLRKMLRLLTFRMMYRPSCITKALRLLGILPSLRF